MSSIRASVWQGGSSLNPDRTAIAGSGMKGIGGKFANSVPGTLAFGAVMGGAGSAIGAGNFWQGAVTGLIVSGFNHLMHGDDPPAKAKKLITEYEKNDIQIQSESMVMDILLETTEQGDILTTFREKVIARYGNYRDNQISDVVSNGVSLLKDFKKNLGNSKFYDLAVYKTSLILGADIMRLSAINYRLSYKIKAIDINYYYKINPTERPNPIKVHYSFSGGGSGGGW